ncbi:hypothetical protein COK00_21825 [Bacillus cereus]|nr:hypothetical protein CON28_00090 [Bacillus cereus]PEX40074.1 hypothetical protein CN455_04615 [Bacillus cereus]PFB16565.1 hypothetical protein CN399_11080 [Bacillus cereus]PFP60639.1 hypothetical protein COK00_21825 [Bacillus cereus]PFV60185.1 hypothetical protein COL09_09500 [Bacillus cereus]
MIKVGIRMKYQSSFLLAEINKKINKQGGIPTVLDNFILSELYSKDQSILFKKIINSKNLSSSRYEQVSKRMERIKASELSLLCRLYSQGKNEVYLWKGQPLFKNLYDKSIYELIIYEICPLTIIEFGATPTSLSWLKSVVNEYNYNTKVMGVNIKDFQIEENIDYLNIDANDIQNIKYKKLLDNLEHPLIIIEDCHVNTKGILELFSNLMRPGDYIIIEDSISKQKEINDWAINKMNFFVDTRYTDFFGINSVSAVNSIIKKMGD